MKKIIIATHGVIRHCYFITILVVLSAIKIYEKFYSRILFIFMVFYIDSYSTRLFYSNRKCLRSVVFSL